MKVSVIIPVYNKEAYVEECLRKVLAQDFDEFEIVVVDDGSTDGSGNICDRVAATDQRIQVHHIANGGVTAARRYGVAHATGQYIMFADADDTLAPHAIRTLYDAMTTSHADEVIGSFQTQNGRIGSSGFRGFIDSSQLLKELLSVRNSFCVLWGILFKRELLEGCLDSPREIIEGEDILMQMLCLLKSPKVFFIRDVVYHYNEGIPNDREKSLDMAKIYNRILEQALRPQWHTYEPYFRLFQLKQYEAFIDKKQFYVYDAYYHSLRGKLDNRIPLQDRIAFLLPPRISYLLVHTYKKLLQIKQSS